MPSSQIQKGLIFITGAVIGGLALAFVVVVLHPELLPGVVAARNAVRVAETPTVAPARPDSVAPEALPAVASPGAPAAGSYAAAVQRAAPAVVNISARRVVTERLPRNLFDELFEIGRAHV